MERYDLIIAYQMQCPRIAGRADRPFPEGQESYNDTYAYFLSRCSDAGIKAAFADANDVTGPGLFSSVWLYRRGWKKKEAESRTNLIFDKFTPRDAEEKRRYALMSSCSVRVFNRRLVGFFHDKLRTYNEFKDFAIPASDVGRLSVGNLLAAKAKLDGLISKHSRRDDFNDGYIVKDRFGSMGQNIFRLDFSGDMSATVKAHRKNAGGRISYILQPFVRCDRFSFGRHRGCMDLRLVLLDHMTVQSYARVAGRGDFRCDGSGRGYLVFLKLESLPEDVVSAAGNISRKLMKVERDSFYSLDFIRSNSGNAYMVEGNDKPGITWAFGEDSPDMTKDMMLRNEKKNKEVIRTLAEKLAALFSSSRRAPR